MFKHAQSNILAKLDHIRYIKVIMDAGEYAVAGGVHMTQAHRLMCMHAIFLHAQANISV